MLVVIWIGLATASLRAGLEQDGAGSTGTAGASACVTAATAGEGDAVVTSSMLPPRAVCVRTVDGRATETVLAEGSTVLAAGAMVAVGSGLVLLVGTLVGSVVVARRRVAGVDPSGVAVDPSTAPPAPARARRPEQPTE